MTEWRWYWIREMGVMSPVLDYGCGVGFFSVWLHNKGYKDLHGYELPGVQREIMVEAFRPRGIKVWDNDGGGFNTVLCLNVLEHVEHPLALLERLYELGKRVIADICIDEHDKMQGPHIAPVDELRECERILRKRRGLYEHEGPQKFKKPEM
ncbi:MAG: class I SAM-dependent methyltransferase [Planctomycetota bacterium]